MLPATKIKLQQYYKLVVGSIQISNQIIEDYYKIVSVNHVTFNNL